ncbi:hypothetical protein [Rickettsia endosymbiont of Halotydeus destructor]|uniref:hypothetical protein n=1 Tax=Rickettsia endosymbiont of Halotydeus destructor TaxID=2996754 RepID=UPI003BB12E3F
MAKEKLLTINEGYNRALETLEMLKEVPAGSRNEFIKDYNNVKIGLSDALLFGKAETCINLAYINREGLHGKKSEYNYKLFLVIGSKLGNNACTKQLSTLHNINEVEREASIWVGFINTNTNKKKPDEEITARDISDIRIRLEATLSDNAIKLDTFKEHYWLKSHDDQIVVSTHDNHTSHSTYHNDDVHLGGQTDFPNTNAKPVKKSFNCDIL